MLVGPGVGWWRRSWSVGIGAAIPVVGAAGVQRRHDRARLPPGVRPPLPARGARLHRARLPPRLGGRGPALPAAEPRRSCCFAAPGDPAGAATRHARDDGPAAVHLTRRDARACSTPRARSPCPRDIGMSILLTSPALLLGIPALFGTAARRRIVLRPRCCAVLLVSVANLMHFSQGWVQFGYRFAQRHGTVRPRAGGAWGSRGSWTGIPDPALGDAARRRPWSQCRSRSTRGAWRGGVSSGGDARPSELGAGRCWSGSWHSSRLAWRCCPGLGYLGHRRAPGGRAGPRDGPPDRLPDVRPAGLARERAAHAVRRAGAADEPVRGTQRRGRRGGDGRSGANADAVRSRSA